MTKTLRISEILTDLENGYTRTTTSPGYDSTIGSIEEKYELSKTQVLELFKHPKLFKKRTIIKKDLGFVIEDDLEVVDNFNSNAETSSEQESEVERGEVIYANDTDGGISDEQIETVEEEVSENPFEFS